MRPFRLTIRRGSSGRYNDQLYACQKIVTVALQYCSCHAAQMEVAEVPGQLPLHGGAGKSMLVHEQSCKIATLVHLILQPRFAIHRSEEKCAYQR